VTKFDLKIRNEDAFSPATKQANQSEAPGGAPAIEIIFCTFKEWRYIASRWNVRIN